MNRLRGLLSRPRRVILHAAAVAAVAFGLVATSTGAAQAVSLHIDYPVSGTTYVKGAGSSMPLGPGQLSSTLDSDTWTVTAATSLPDATLKFWTLDLIPVTAKVQFVEAQPTVGTIDPYTGALSTTSYFTIKIKQLIVAGIPQLIGDSCQTESPAVIPLTSGADWGVIKGGTLSGTYTIPNFHNCILEAPLINLIVPGAGNTISLLLGPAES
ncbi:hypothetical protein [Streptomyces sp. NPDC020917]|uniref:hypothetical protein n=1 Tax=Streptomyces sp. NPDC020917 TaxID=3365102 RepID=UPI0037AD4B58